jgi:hypothetical protein
MPGRYSSFPLWFGDNIVNQTELLERSYLAAHGSGFAKADDEAEPDGYLSCESLAVAETLACAFATEQQYANQSNPNTLSVYLDRWEQILKIVPRPTDTESQRRDFISNRIHYLSLPSTRSNVTSFLEDTLGSGFSSVHLKTYDEIGPETGFEYEVSSDHSMDLSLVGGYEFTTGNYFSSTCSLIIITDPSAVSLNELFRRIKNLSLLDDWLPSWVTWKVASNNLLYPDTDIGLGIDQLS